MHALEIFTVFSLVMMISTVAKSAAVSDCSPPVHPDVSYGKHCGSVGCINSNIGYTDLYEAWTKCGQVAECGFIMVHSNCKYYLRRASDPNAQGFVGYVYSENRVPLEYDVLDNGPGCGALSLDENECKIAIMKLGYNLPVQKGHWDHAPPGCFVGHPGDGWEHSYFNTIAVGTTGKPMYRSICKKDSQMRPRNMGPKMWDCSTCLEWFLCDDCLKIGLCDIC